MFFFYFSVMLLNLMLKKLFQSMYLLDTSHLQNCRWIKQNPVLLSLSFNINASDWRSKIVCQQRFPLTWATAFSCHSFRDVRMNSWATQRLLTRQVIYPKRMLQISRCSDSRVTERSIALIMVLAEPHQSLVSAFKILFFPRQRERNVSESSDSPAFFWLSLRSDAFTNAVYVCGKWLSESAFQHCNFPAPIATI